MRWFIIGVLLFVSGTSHAGIKEFLFGNDNFYECILYEMPDAENDQQASQIHKQCKQNYPLSIPLIRKKTYLGVDSATRCVEALVQEVSSRVAQGWMKNACYKVYVKK